jgi:hypothetical protein
VFRNTVGVWRQLLQSRPVYLAGSLKVTPRPELEVGAPKIRPPCDSTMDRVIASPTPGLCDKECTESLVTARLLHARTPLRGLFRDAFGR